MTNEQRAQEAGRAESTSAATGTKPKAWLAWSSGKDSAWALHVARQAGELDIVGLLTTVNTTHGRVAMHAVREQLLEAQAAAVGLPLLKVALPWPCSNEIYEQAMAAAMRQAQSEGVTHVVFGDLFLEDVRRYRVDKLAACGMIPAFPIWLRETRALAEEMIAAGLRAWLTCVDPRKLPASFAGRAFDAALLRDLPPGVDPCGENGEFHSFVCDGPMLRHPIAVRPGEVVEREGFVFADLLPAGE